ncbi:CASP-like protein [Acorus gramineus]|uniref:CASP-like protein n=1 Tax=Acorus gramineus TaxID=55184 RepID=A0AAV9B0Z3_ACOGR|nr:CASP-like protein [Acorus gramineus]
MAEEGGPTIAGVNKSTAAPPETTTRDLENPSSGPVKSIVRRWGREDLLEKARLTLRATACVFSLLAFVVMASNKHGYGKNFDEYEEYRYLVAIGVLAFLYAGAQVLRQVHRFSTGREVMSKMASGRLDFGGDQVMAYMLMSALSAAIPMTNRIREGADNTFTDTSAAAISMAFFAFVALALSAIISGFKLSNQSYI